jgi:hypothetical protein
MLYKKLLFENSHKWTLTDIDNMDVHFFHELLETEEVKQEKEVYLSDIW